MRGVCILQAIKSWRREGLGMRLECEGRERVEEVVWALLPTSVTLFPGVWQAEGRCAESTE